MSSGTFYLNPNLTDVLKIDKNQDFFDSSTTSEAIKKIEYKRYGDVVQVTIPAFKLKTSITTGWMLVTSYTTSSGPRVYDTLPEGYRPASTFYSYFSDYQSGSVVPCVLRITTGGQLTIRTITSSLPAGAYISVGGTFLT